MRRRIVFVRHVTSPHPRGVSDFDRPIDDSGREDGKKLARHLESRGDLPRRVLCSDAKRARETFEAMKSGVGREEAFETDFERKLYKVDIEGTCEYLWGLPDDRDEVLLVGHNPVWSDAVSWLTGIRTEMPKGSAAILECSGETWSDAVQQRSCELAEFVRPTELD